MWDYLIITASNDAQANGYQDQIDTRINLGLLSNVREVLVIADPEGKRVGSGGSTLYCLSEIVQRHIKDGLNVEDILSNLRILIVHAGGDSKRLPAYSPCGKLFIPVPGNNDTSLALTLFDRQINTYLDLPKPENTYGQVVITSGDVLLSFCSNEVSFNNKGITALATLADPKQASKHGVFLRAEDNTVRRFLQKPSIPLQEQIGALDALGLTALDIGVMSFDAETAVKLLKIADFEVKNNKCGFGKGCIDNIFKYGLDFYLHICCALGTEITEDIYNNSIDPDYPSDFRKKIYKCLSDIDFNVELLPFCEFLHFGTSCQITQSGLALLRKDSGISLIDSCFVNNIVSDSGKITGKDSWVESCFVDAKLNLEGYNVLTGVDVKEDLSVPEGACIDLTEGVVDGENLTFLRIYGIKDEFKQKAYDNAYYCNRPVLEWIEQLRIKPQDIWGDEIDSVWTAKMFPAIKDFTVKDWLWMYDTEKATDERIDIWRKSKRFSLEDISKYTDRDAFFQRRSTIRSQIVQNSLLDLFKSNSGFSAKELGMCIKFSPNSSQFISSVVSLMYNLREVRGSSNWQILPRIAHSLATALEYIYNDEKYIYKAVKNLHKHLKPDIKKWFEGFLSSQNPTFAMLKQVSFGCMSKIIIDSNIEKPQPFKNRLRADEIVWARSPARMDIGGGWSDTPPYSLVYGGSVMNVAIDLNSQPPIHVYVRATENRTIKISSIDLGVSIDVSNFDDLTDYKKADSEFALAKAAVALSGFGPEFSKFDTLESTLDYFGAGLEITTLAAIPKGSGLGTSSIVGAALVAAVNKVLGRALTHKQLFYEVLKLEQALTTGGGWQDQLGGVLPGAKLGISPAGIEPAVAVNYVPYDVIDPKLNNGKTLLYYTGITRLAKNILEQVVSKQFDCDRLAMQTIRDIHRHSQTMADAFMKKDYEQFARCVDICRVQNNTLDPDSTNSLVEGVIKKIDKYCCGKKLLGAGGGGFMLICSKSKNDSEKIKKILTDNPPNCKARFFEYSVNDTGLSVTVC